MISVSIGQKMDTAGGFTSSMTRKSIENESRSVRTPILSSQRRVNTSYEGTRKKYQIKQANAIASMAGKYGQGALKTQADFTAQQHHFGNVKGLVDGWAVNYNSIHSPKKDNLSKQGTQTSTMGRGIETAASSQRVKQLHLGSETRKRL